jgi:hypothetical protein
MLDQWREAMQRHAATGVRSAPGSVLGLNKSPAEDPLEMTGYGLGLVHKLAEYGEGQKDPDELSVDLHQRTISPSQYFAAFLKTILPRKAVRDKLCLAAEQAIHAARKALSMRKPRSVHIDPELVKAFRSIARIAGFLDLCASINLLDVLKQLQARLELLVLVPVQLGLSPPPPQPLDRTPQLQPNAPNLTA